ncbi:MAG TPA: NAD-dependent DNA ligase LigA [Spirochaetota bacterium]|nr:NAD-dependent DNA ligase LigA [Spirochaetota bacterium]HOM37596.1 NAD-dependent DNA ligase LigA [Spirochaetota bacterium]HPQ49433.1 NAD-dependent DNA ligase LigA [Spirochaetota bacterium]
MDKKEKMQELIKKIQYHDYLYYVLNKPEISDIQYDKLVNELKELEKETGIILAGSPTQRVPSDITNNFAEVEHKIPVLSLDKAYNIDELIKWLNSNKIEDFVAEPKIDGFSVVLYYTNGILEYALSRGDGKIGNDLTNNIKTIRSIPVVLENKINMAIRGEVFINRDDFIKYNEKMGNIYANPRNFAAGSIRRISPEDVAKIPLRIFVYDLYTTDIKFKTHIESLEFLVENRFPTPIENIALFSDKETSKHFQSYKVDQIAEFIKNITEKRKKLQYDIDGIVLKTNNIDLREKLGYTSHHPKWAIAYKFESPTNISEVLDIKVQVGRTGKITPLAIIRPIKISGSTVQKATLHNQEYIDELEIGIGDTVLVSKRGDIIPAIEKVIEKKGEVFKIPEKCPECYSKLEKDGAHLFCKNRHCPARIRESIFFFVDKLEINGIGKNTVEKLLENKIIKNIKDLFIIDFDIIKNLEGFADKKVKIIKDSIENVKKKEFAKLFEAIGIESIGPNVIKLLIENRYDSFDKLIEIAKNKKTEELSKIEGIGPITALKIVEAFNDPEILDLIQFFKEKGFQVGVEKKTEESSSNKIFENTVWVITGSFDNFKPREKAKEIIEKLGGKVTDSVSKNTTYLLVGKEPGSKLEKALKIGIRTISEEEFLKIITNKQDSN